MPHVLYRPESIDFWVKYYHDSVHEQTQHQLGGGGGGGGDGFVSIPDIQGFRARSPYQRGTGLGSFFKGLFRLALPLFKSAAATVGREALAAGSHIAANVVQGRDLSESAQEHGKQAVGNLLHKAGDKISGRGLGVVSLPKKKKSYKNKRQQLTKRKKNHSVVSHKRRRTVVSDIFS